MIKIGDEYLEYDDLPDVVRQVKTPDTIDVAGDFSYSFTVQATPKNVRLLKARVNQSDGNLNRKIPCVYERFGNPIHIGYLAIDGVNASGIQLSFFSGNTEWFQTIEEAGAIYNLDLSAYKLPLSNINPSPVVIGSWGNTEGIIYPLMDLGDLVNWGPKVVSSFIPMVYVKTVMQAIFQQNGFKIDGEIFTDSVYNQLVAGVDNQFDPSLEYLTSRNAYIGKGAQALNTTPQLVTFTQDTYPFYNGGQFGANRYTADEDMSMLVIVDFQLDASADYVIELRRNGSVVSTIQSSGSVISSAFNSRNVVTIDEDQYFEVWMYLSSGTVNIVSGSVTYRIIRFDATYPQFLFGNMTQIDFVRGIFRMLNVVSTYDQFNKTVTCNLFKNVRDEEKDLSRFVSDIEVDNTSLGQEIGQKTRFVFQESEGEQIKAYNESNDIPYAGGAIVSESELLGEDVEYDVPFTASFGYYNETFKTWLANLGLNSFQEAEHIMTFSSVTNSAGNALFTTVADHELEQLDYVRIKNTDTGEYIGDFRVSSVPTTTTFTLQFAPYTSTVAVTGIGVKLTGESNFNGSVFIGMVLPNYPVSSFMKNETSINYGGVTHSNIAYFYFVKDNLGLPIDGFRELPVFDADVVGAITLLDKYYGEQKKYFNKPLKLLAKMYLPLNVYNGIDQTKSVSIKTEFLDVKGFVVKNEGYKGVDVECLFEVINLQ